MIVIVGQRVAQNGKSFLFSVKSCNFAIFRTFDNNFTSTMFKALCDKDESIVSIIGHVSKQGA